MSTLLLILGSVCTGIAVATGYGEWIAAIDRVNRAYEADLRARMARIAMDTSQLSSWMRFRVAGAVAIALVLGFGLGMLPVGLLAAVVIFAVMPLFLERAIDRQRTLIRDQLVIAARALAGQVRGGVTLSHGLRSVSRNVPRPLGALLRSCVGQFESGVTLEGALADLKDRVQVEQLSLFAIALSIAAARKEGAALAEVLDKIALSLTEDQRIDRKRETDVAAGRLTMNVLACYPPAFLGLFYLIDPAATHLVFSSFAGQMILCLVGGITWLSLWLARRIFGRIT